MNGAEGKEWKQRRERERGREGQEEDREERDRGGMSVYVTRLYAIEKCRSSQLSQDEPREGEIERIDRSEDRMK